MVPYGGLDELATRLCVTPHHWGHAMYTIHLGEVTIPVRNPHWLKRMKGRERMVFTWPDGGQCTVTGPNPPSGAIDVISPRGRVWSGLPVDPRIQKKTAQPATFLWHLEDQVIVCEAGRLCCRTFFPVSLMLTLREWDGRRLASWFVRRPRQGCLREGIHEDMKAVVLGMILSSMYDFCPTPSD